MRLLVVSHSCAQPVNQDVYVEMARITGWELSLVLPANWKDEFGNRLDLAPRDCWSGGATKTPVWMNGNIILHSYRMGWRAFLEKGRFDVVYVNHEPYAVATAQVARACRSVSKPPVFGFYSCQNICKRYPFPFSYMESTVYTQARFAFPITAAVRDVLARKGFHGRLEVCPLPVDTGRCKPGGTDADRELIAREDDEVVIGYMGRIVEAKGLRTLAEALGRIRDLRWKLIIVGSGEFEPALRELLESNQVANRVHFKGYVPHDETAAYLSAFDLLVLPSETQANWEEQFGRVIPEALACGTCVLGSDSGEIPLLISQSGGGEIFPQRRSEALAEALRLLILNPRHREELAARGMKWVQDHLSLQATATKMADTILECHEKSD